MKPNLVDVNLLKYAILVLLNNDNSFLFPKNNLNGN